MCSLNEAMFLKMQNLAFRESLRVCPKTCQVAISIFFQNSFIFSPLLTFSALLFYLPMLFHAKLKWIQYNNHILLWKKSKSVKLKELKKKVWLLKFGLCLHLDIYLYSQRTKHNRYIYHSVGFDPIDWCWTKCSKQQLVVEITACC